MLFLEESGDLRKCQGDKQRADDDNAYEDPATKSVPVATVPVAVTVSAVVEAIRAVIVPVAHINSTKTYSGRCNQGKSKREGPKHLECVKDCVARSMGWGLPGEDGHVELRMRKARKVGKLLKSAEIPV